MKTLNLPSASPIGLGAEITTVLFPVSNIFHGTVRNTVVGSVTWGYWGMMIEALKAEPSRYDNLLTSHKHFG